MTALLEARDALLKLVAEFSLATNVLSGPQISLHQELFDALRTYLAALEAPQAPVPAPATVSENTITLAEKLQIPVALYWSPPGFAPDTYGVVISDVFRRELIAELDRQAERIKELERITSTERRAYQAFIDEAAKQRDEAIIAQCAAEARIKELEMAHHARTLATAPCIHPLWQREGEVADGACSICMAERIKELETAEGEMRKVLTIIETKLLAAKHTGDLNSKWKPILAAIRELKLKGE